MKDKNILIMTGRLVDRVELRQSGDFKVAKFRIANNRSYTNKQGNTVDETSFFNIETFGALASVCNQYLSKGRRVLISGRLKNDNYETKEGEKRYGQIIQADEVDFLDAPNDQKSQPDSEDSAAQDSNKIKHADDLKKLKRESSKDKLPF